jgi:hypothetical protein
MEGTMRYQRLLIRATVASVATVAAAIQPLGAQVSRPAAGAPGYSYTVTVRATTNGARAALPGAPVAGEGYAARALVTGNRGRLDIIEGRADSVFAKGDYLLFDSTDVIIVHPSTKVFVPLDREASSRALEGLEAMGFQITVSDEKVTLDSLGASDTVAGVPTKHYRLTVAFNMSMDAGVMQQRLGSENVTDYWVAQVPGLPANPLLRSNGFAGSAMTGMLKGLSARVDSVAARMGNTVALRTSGRMRVITGPGQELQTQQTSEVSDLRRRDVDRTALVLPADYKSAIDGAPPSAADKWRVLPR